MRASGLRRSGAPTRAPRTLRWRSWLERSSLQIHRWLRRLLVVLIDQFCYVVAATASQCCIAKGLAKNMSRELIPTAGRWYRDLERDESFKVVTVDEDDDLVEIQHSDGEIEELESAEWYEMDLERIEEPEDWLRED